MKLFVVKTIIFFQAVLLMYCFKIRLKNQKTPNIGIKNRKHIVCLIYFTKLNYYFYTHLPNENGVKPCCFFLSNLKRYFIRFGRIFRLKKRDSFYMPRNFHILVSTKNTIYTLANQFQKNSTVETHHNITSRIIY